MDFPKHKNPETQKFVDEWNKTHTRETMKIFIIKVSPSVNTKSNAVNSA